MDWWYSLRVYFLEPRLHVLKRQCLYLTNYTRSKIPHDRDRKSINFWGGCVQHHNYWSKSTEKHSCFHPQPCSIYKFRENSIINLIRIDTHRLCLSQHTVALLSNKDYVRDGLFRTEGLRDRDETREIQDLMWRTKRDWTKVNTESLISEVLHLTEVSHYQTSTPPCTSTQDVYHPQDPGTCKASDRLCCTLIPIQSMTFPEIIPLTTHILGQTKGQ